MTVCIIAVGDRPIGYAQFYPWDAEAEEAPEMGFPMIDGLLRTRHLHR